MWKYFMRATTLGHKISCECDSMNAVMDGGKEGGREGGFSDFLSTDVLKIAELFEEDKFIRDLKGSLSSHQEKSKTTKCEEI